MLSHATDPIVRARVSPPLLLALATPSQGGGCGYMGVPAGTGYLQIAGSGMTFCPFRVVGADAGMEFGSRIWVHEIGIHTNFTRCHP